MDKIYPDKQDERVRCSHLRLNNSPRMELIVIINSSSKANSLN